VTEATRYKQAWGDRRARVFMLLAMIIGFCVSLQPWPNALIAGACFVGALIGAYGYYQFRCPRCHERFLPFPRDEPVFRRRRRCQNCGLEKNATPEDSRQ
jgi:hypothetical protein